jgi:hypothetical protein
MGGSLFGGNLYTLGFDDMEIRGDQPAEDKVECSQRPALTLYSQKCVCHSDTK